MEPSWGSATANDYKAVILGSHGPDKENDDGEWGVLPGNQSGVSGRRNAAFLYDPSNGALSKGDIVRGVGELERIANEQSSFEANPPPSFRRKPESSGLDESSPHMPYRLKLMRLPSLPPQGITA